MSTLLSSSVKGVEGRAKPELALNIPFCRRETGGGHVDIRS